MSKLNLILFVYSRPFFNKFFQTNTFQYFLGGNLMAVAILPSTAIYPQRLFCRELFVIGQS